MTIRLIPNIERALAGEAIVDMIREAGFVYGGIDPDAPAIPDELVIARTRTDARSLKAYVAILPSPAALRYLADIIERGEAGR